MCAASNRINKWTKGAQRETGTQRHWDTRHKRENKKYKKSKLNLEYINFNARVDIELCHTTAAIYKYSEPANYNWGMFINSNGISSYNSTYTLFHVLVLLQIGKFIMLFNRNRSIWICWMEKNSNSLILDSSKSIRFKRLFVCVWSLWLKHFTTCVTSVFLSRINLIFLGVWSHSLWHENCATK